MIRLLASVAEKLARAAELERCDRRLRGLNAMVFLTYRCGSRCRTCTMWKRTDPSSEELGWEQWRTVLDRLCAYGIKTVELFGGDALLRKDIIFRMIEHCSRNGMATYFPTNSLLLDRDTAASLVEAGLDTIYFSLDDVGETGDAIRGSDGSFAKVKQALENVLAERGEARHPKIEVCTTVSNMNCDRFVEIVRFLSRYRVDTINPRVVGEFSKEKVESSVVDGVRAEPYFVPSDGSSHLLSADELRRFRESLDAADCIEGAPFVNRWAVDMAGDDAFTKGLYEAERCLLCTTLVTVDPYGNAMPCPMFRDYRLGSLVEADPGQVWGNARHRIFVERQRAGAIELCRNCNIRIYYPRLADVMKYYYRKAREKAWRRLGRSASSGTP
ncbi:MAG TPA: radical SAM protein [Deltaproteobacteria bacterium]|nr:radical SAM protein [Deltaproteobacteria bacterium]